MGNIVRGTAPFAGTPGSFLNKQSVPGQKIVSVGQAISDIGSDNLQASGSGAFDTGYVSNRLAATSNGKLIDFADIFAATWSNAFVNDETASDFTKEILRGTAVPEFTSEQAYRITVGQYNPFTPTTGYSSENVINFHNYDTAQSYFVFVQSFWKVFIIGDIQ